MPKADRKKKGKPVTPYNSLSRKQNDADTEELDEQLNCDKCTKHVDSLIQCERCEHWYCDKCTGLLSSVMDIVFMYKQLHWFCEDCDKVVTDTVPKSSNNNRGGSTHEDLVKDIVVQVGQVIKEANECIKKTLSESLQGSLSSADNTTMEMENPPSLSSSNSTSEVIATYLEEEKERSKRCLNVIVHNTEESPTDMGRQEKNMMLTQLCQFLINTWVLNPIL